MVGDDRVNPRVQIVRRYRFVQQPDLFGICCAEQGPRQHRGPRIGRADACHHMGRDIGRDQPQTHLCQTKACGIDTHGDVTN